MLSSTWKQPRSVRVLAEQDTAPWTRPDDVRGDREDDTGVDR